MKKKLNFYFEITNESTIYKEWDRKNTFRPSGKGEAYSIFMPPPNVTGVLHVGHALDTTLQDILIRFKRMQGYNTLWIPGVDHAGIATQMVVERTLAAKGITRKLLSRETFIEYAYIQKDTSANRIIDQLKALGASCDWSQLQFTLNPHFVKAVTTAFVQLYKAKLIYKATQLVNFDPKLETTLSDLEVKDKIVKGHMWTIGYPMVDNAQVKIPVATTRPETMFGDVALIVNPKDKRYTAYIGKKVRVPLNGRVIPILADSYADIESGTGVVKITPAHDFHDFEVGQRHQLPKINIFTPKAELNDSVPQAYQGLDRYVAREKVVADLDSQHLLLKVEQIEHSVPHGDRSEVPLEPRLTTQWFVKVKPMAEKALHKLEQNQPNIIPENWRKVYRRWLENIQPWAISRQLWWGHQIPAWYGPDGKIFVAESEKKAVAEAEKIYKKSVILQRDPDVLDTWFSSSLWPIAGFGWPDKTKLWDIFFPSNVLVTAFDIIFFWVARMTMVGLYFTKEIPFKTVYIHPLIKDKSGQKMSKSKGNVLNPLVLTEKWGTDAVRFALAYLETGGQDIKLSESIVQQWSYFVNKIWNVAKFYERIEKVNNVVRIIHPLNMGIVNSTNRFVYKVTNALEQYRFGEAATYIARWIRSYYCDEYLEGAKILLQDITYKEETSYTLKKTFETILKVLHPFMPFISEYLWGHFFPYKGMLIQASWPEGNTQNTSDTINTMYRDTFDIVREVRSMKMLLNIPPGSKLKATYQGDSIVKPVIEALARCEFAEGISGITLSVRTFSVTLPLPNTMDIENAIKKLMLDIKKIQAEIQKLEKKLFSDAFLTNAQKTAVDKVRESYSNCKDRLYQLTAQYNLLHSV